MANDTDIRQSPYEPGLYFVPPQPGTTLQSIGMTEWKVGERYTLHKVLGYGSFSCVCLATDNATGERVALKRIGDVMHSVDQAKRVLREIAILRRVNHPNLVSLQDAFYRPSATGQCRMIGGRLVHSSIDLYLALEYADGGDLFHLRGQLSPEEATSLLWQLLQACAYLHSLDVWHRDVKSQNAFITWEHGVRVVKLGDFGSARSAIARCRSVEGGVSPLGGGGGVSGLHPADSFKEMEAAMLSSDLYEHPEDSTTTTKDKNMMQEGGANAAAPNTNNSNNNNSSRQGGGGAAAVSGSGVGRGYKAPLTRVVATPCYRAPEVVMSRGGYSAPIDMWGVGCIFGELLQRVTYVGSAATPHLQVAPLFAIRGMPKTPCDGETFGRPECAGTRRELQALFDVVGTPAWSDAAAVEMEEWRIYLARLPGKAPTLQRRFKSAGEVAVHLLSRLLEFDPRRRATCEEALSHEFFAALRAVLENSGAPVAASPAVSGRESDFIAVMRVDGEEEEEESSDVEMEGAAASTLSIGKEESVPLMKLDSLAVDAAAAVATWGATATVNNATENLPPVAAPENFWEENNPGRALAMLERELEGIAGGPNDTDPTSEGCQRLRKMLEAECHAVAEVAKARAAAHAAGEQPPPKPYAPPNNASAGLVDMFLRRGPGLQEDTGGHQGHGGRDFGRERLSNVADTWQGKELDPRKFLGPKRHGEWTAQGGGGGPAPGPRWGVATVPPGLEGDTSDPRVQAIMKKQQGR